MCPVSKSYEVIFGSFPSGLPLWQVAKAVVENFDGSKTGEELGRNALEYIISFVKFPDNLTTVEVVGHAERLLPEICDDYDPNEEVHMALVERVVWLRGGYS